MNQPHPYLTPRQKAREVAFQFLYRLDLEKTVDAKDFEKHAAHFQIPAESFEFAERLVRTTTTCLTAVDDMITKHAQNWRIERIGSIEKAFLRMGVAELLYFKDVPASVTLNEVIELSKLFGEADTPSFLNGILDPIAKEEQTTLGKVVSE
jgi:N utilization substance protein B